MSNSTPITLDSFDIGILSALQEDASRSIGDIAAEVNLSQNACWRRIKILEETGVIRKRVALLDPELVGCGITVFVSLKAGEHSEDWLESFADRAARMPEVVEFYRMTGDVDYLLKLQVKDIKAYDEVYKTLIRMARLSDVSAAFAMEELKHTHAVPLPTVREPGPPRRAKP
ncbi:MAG TPA: Lrp/AsnC family transcriptional regulator [Caulobacteraceae bacterium]|jgi:Lrp/AsnC family transcriptional regulator